MRMRPETIRLGEQSWLVRPLTLAQVQAIEPLLFDPSRTGTVVAAIAIVKVALARDHAEAATTLESIEAGAPDVASAMAIVLRLGGFLPDGEGELPKGEADAPEGGSG